MSQKAGELYVGEDENWSSGKFSGSCFEVLNLHAFNVCANYLNLSAIEIVPAIVSVALCEKPCSCSCTLNMEKS